MSSCGVVLHVEKRRRLIVSLLPSSIHLHVTAVVPGLKDASYKPVTGEEEETCVLQVRLYWHRTEI